MEPKNQNDWRFTGLPYETAVSRLHNLEQQVKALASQILPSTSMPLNPMPAEAIESEELAKRLRRYLRARQARSEYFGDLFTDPAWDILLEVFVSDLEHRHVSISGACSSAVVPPSTALRWIKHLEEQVLLVRSPDIHDARRSHLKLSQSAKASMKAYLERHSAFDCLLQRD